MNSPRKAVVIGLDGTPYSLIKRFCEEGVLPNLAKIIATGSLRPMNSVLPTVSSVAWATFMTGVNPGKHGIYGFVDRVPDSYEIYIPNSRSMKAKTLWEILSENGKKVIVINVPVTYPARQINGVLVPCFLMPNLDKGPYPEWVGPKLKEMGYRIDVDPWQARESLDKFLEDLDYTLAKRAEAAFYFMDSQEWDFFMLHIMETDRLHHFLWEHMENGDPKYAPAFLSFYSKLDDFFGELVQRIGDETRLIILSDHGFCTIKSELYINYWLRQKGWLKFKRTPPESWIDIDGASKAYSLDPGRIYINLKGREPQGCVEPGKEYEGLREKLIEEIEALRNPGSGELMIEKVFTKEELYHGPYTSWAPDLVVKPRWGYDVKGSPKKESLTDRGPIVGMHTYEDAFLFVRGQDLTREVAELVDLLPTILPLMQLSVPSQLDGSSL